MELAEPKHDVGTARERGVVIVEATSQFIYKMSILKENVTLGLDKSDC